jgi:hypothetical protein
MKPKQCKNKNCGNKFTPERQFQTTCDYNCAIEYAKQLQAKKQTSEKRTALKQFNDSDANVMKRKAIHTFNAFIRARDKDNPCVSCGVIVKENMAHASHFKPANTYSYLRFDESNVHKSCSRCNVFLSGNLNEYRIRIVERIGQSELDRLDMPNQSKKWSIEELKNIIETYKQKIKQI